VPASPTTNRFADWVDESGAVIGLIFSGATPKHRVPSLAAV